MKSETIGWISLTSAFVLLMIIVSGLLFYNHTAKAQIGGTFGQHSGTSTPISNSLNAQFLGTANNIEIYVFNDPILGTVCYLPFFEGGGFSKTLSCVN